MREDVHGRYDAAEGQGSRHAMMCNANITNNPASAYKRFSLILIAAATRIGAKPKPFSSEREENGRRDRPLQRKHWSGRAKHRPNARGHTRGILTYPAVLFPNLPALIPEHAGLAAALFPPLPRSLGLRRSVCLLVLRLLGRRCCGVRTSSNRISRLRSQPEQGIGASKHNIQKEIEKIQIGQAEVQDDLIRASRLWTTPHAMGQDRPCTLTLLGLLIALLLSQVLFPPLHAEGADLTIVFAPVWTNSLSLGRGTWRTDATLARAAVAMSRRGSLVTSDIVKCLTTSSYGACHPFDQCLS